MNDSELLKQLQTIKQAYSMELTKQEQRLRDGNGPRTSEEIYGELEINESYMCLPATPSKNIPDRFFDHRNVVIVQPSSSVKDASTDAIGSRRVVVDSTNERRISVTADTPTLQLPPTFPFLRQTSNPSENPSATGISGHSLLKAIGFHEVLYAASFDKRPSCQASVSTTCLSGNRCSRITFQTKTQMQNIAMKMIDAVTKALQAKRSEKSVEGDGNQSMKVDEEH